ncbi:MAG: septum formation protein Maf [Flavobacteriaceae bacterium]|nr:septum formation protein Maf [Flavobacteriaceae bacterium]|tara:strand:+ start:79 stop:672 length:594 start_codon:yes stop_codon:yes gene_type:complete
MLYQQHEIILASGSPRRKAFMEQLNIPFTVKTIPVDEVFPSSLKGKFIAEHIVKKKNAPFTKIVKPKQIIITADTIVWCDQRYLGKPNNIVEAKEMLEFLSGKVHEVITAVGFLTARTFEVLTETTQVYFKKLKESEIDHYLKLAPPLDKAGAYGIQDWIGTVGIAKIEGSYTNVVGLPLPGVKEKIEDLIAAAERN